MRRALSIAALLLLLVPFGAQAQLRLLVGGGLSAPSGGFGDVVEAGWHGQAGLQVMVPTLPFALRADGSVHRLSSKVAGAGTTQLTAGAVSLAYFLPGIALQPYFLAGYGAYNVKAGPVDAQETVSENGFHGGFGVAVGGTGFSAFAELRYVRLDDASGVRVLPFTVGLRF